MPLKPTLPGLTQTPSRVKVAAAVLLQGTHYTCAKATEEGRPHEHLKWGTWGLGWAAGLEHRPALFWLVCLGLCPFLVNVNSFQASLTRDTENVVSRPFSQREHMNSPWFYTLRDGQNLSSSVLIELGPHRSLPVSIFLLSPTLQKRTL